MEGKRLSGELVGVDGKLRAGSQADDRRRFLGGWDEACAGEAAAAAALVMEIGLCSSRRGEGACSRDARGGVEREEEVLLARSDCSATQVAWILVALWGGNVGVRGGESIDDG